MLCVGLVYCCCVMCSRRYEKILSYQVLQDDKGTIESLAHSIKNHADLRSENSQAPAAIFPNVVGAASLRPVLPSQSKAWVSYLFFSILVLKA